MLVEQYMYVWVWNDRIALYIANKYIQEQIVCICQFKQERNILWHMGYVCETLVLRNYEWKLKHDSITNMRVNNIYQYVIGKPPICTNVAVFISETVNYRSEEANYKWDIACSISQVGADLDLNSRICVFVVQIKCMLLIVFHLHWRNTL